MFKCVHIKMPDFNDQEAVQRFFLQEVQLGESLLASGALEEVCWFHFEFGRHFFEKLPLSLSIS